MAMAVEIGSLIESKPRVRGGRPCLSGTGVPVHRIVGWYQLGESAEEIAGHYDHLSLAQIHAALAYYHANSEEIEGYLERERLDSETLEREARIG